MKYVKSIDGVMRTTIRVNHRLTEEEVEVVEKVLARFKEKVPTLKTRDAISILLRQAIANELSEGGPFGIEDDSAYQNDKGES